MNVHLPALTIKAKLVIAYTLVFGLLISIFAFAVYRSTRDARLAKLDALLQAHAGKLLTEIEEDVNDQEDPKGAWLRSLTTEGLAGARLQLLLPSGQLVMADSLLQQSPDDAGPRAFHGAVQRATLLVGGRYYRALWQPVEIDEKVPYVLELAAPMHDLLEELEHLRLLFEIAIPVVLLLTGLAAYGITHAAFRPITEMTEAARRISAQNLDARLDLPRAQDEVRRLGETLNDLIERLESAFHSQRQFVADASHEIRSPLAVIRTELELALRETESPSIRESIRISLGEIDRLTRMSSQLLMLARLDANPSDLRTEPVRLDELLVECVQRTIFLAEPKGTKIEVYVEDAIEIRADGEKLKSVFLNLLDNAVKYSTDHGMVKVSLRLAGIPSGTVEVSVDDNGPGIAHADQPRIFQRFYRCEAHRGQGGGCGLGLAIAAQIVQMHRGTLTVKSEEGRGATFTVTLPVDPLT
ncbi:MAG TPA: HAMP domain-containing sensor histidine kinase [bacterium]|jgi:signal transduction histidine kinase